MQSFCIIAKEMKLLLKIFSILIFGVVFNTKASFAFQDHSAVYSSQQQEFKQIESYGSNAAFLEHSRVLSPVHSEVLSISVPALFTFISHFSFTGYISVSIYQKKLKMLRQLWLWLILFPFHSFD